MEQRRSANCRNDKKVQMEQLIMTHRPNITIATETPLNEDINSKTIFNSYYLNPPPYRKDWYIGQGGVKIDVKIQLRQ